MPRRLTSATRSLVALACVMALGISFLVTRAAGESQPALSGASTVLPATEPAAPGPTPQLGPARGLPALASEPRKRKVRSRKPAPPAPPPAPAPRRPQRPPSPRTPRLRLRHRPCRWHRRPRPWPPLRRHRRLTRRPCTSTTRADGGQPQRATESRRSGPRRASPPTDRPCPFGAGRRRPPTHPAAALLGAHPRRSPLGAGAQQARRYSARSRHRCSRGGLTPVRPCRTRPPPEPNPRLPDEGGRARRHRHPARTDA